MLSTSRRLRSTFFWVTASMLFLLGAVSCGGSDEGGQGQEELAPVSKVTAERQYVGRVEGTEALIGIAVRDQTSELIAYICDGPPDSTAEEPIFEAWFQGPIEGDQVSLTADGSEDQLQVVLRPEDANGTFTDVDGQSYSFVARPVARESETGLYWTKPLEGEGLSTRGGTIVLADGEEKGKRTKGPRPKGGKRTPAVEEQAFSANTLATGFLGASASSQGEWR